MYTMNTQKRGRPSVVQSTSSLSGGGGSGSGNNGAGGSGVGGAGGNGSGSAGGSGPGASDSGASAAGAGSNDGSSRPKDTRDPRETAHPRDPRRHPPASAAASDNLTDELAALFECPVCFEFVLPPIMQCQVGHLVCASCRPKLSCCPTCRGTLGDFRNISMEKVANNLLFPCKHKQTGCRMSLALNNKAEHEEVCEFRPYSCPCPGTSCCWTGQLEEVMDHLDRAHKNILTLKGEDIVFLATEINLPGAVDWVMMQSCFGHHFMLILAKQEKCVGHTQFFAIVQLIGSRKQAEHFAYRLELNGNRRRLTWEAMPRSSHEGVASAIMGSDCLVFDTSIAQLFTDHNNLSINVTISVVC